MGTRKLLTSLAFIFLSAAASAQEQIAVTPTIITKTSAATDAVEEFTVSKDGLGRTVISWRSTSAKPLEFLVQGSKDGKTFRAIKRLPAASSNRYETSDDAHPDYAYFRVICIDEGGQVTYSKQAAAR